MEDKEINLNNISDKPRSLEWLRKRAEQQLASSPIKKNDGEAYQRQVHELQVYQIELEMQNEELRMADININAALKNYTELYNLAPIPYLTIGSDGTILHANDAASSLLGKALNVLYKLRFGIFVSDTGLPMFNTFLDKAYASSDKESHETNLLVQGNKLSVVLHTRLNQQGNDLLVEVVDMTQQKLSEQLLIEIEIKSERLQLQTFIKVIPDLVWVKDVSGVFLNCNSRVESLLGIKVEDILGKTDYDFFDKSLADSFRFHDMAAMQSNTPLVNEEQVTFADGHTEPPEKTKTAMFDQDGKIIGVLGIGRNIAEHQHAEARLRKSEERYALAIAGTQGDLRDELILANEEKEKRTAELGLANIELAFQNKEKDKRAAELALANEEKEKRSDELALAKIELAFQNKEKERLADELMLTNRHQDQLERIAHYDILTNLPNRSLLADRLSQAMVQCSRQGRSLAVVFLDLDAFKEVNDIHGHGKGDELLITLSLRMKEALREGDTLARFGGDEFVAVLTNLAKVEDCKQVLKRFLLAASEPIKVGGVVVKVSASIGVTLYPQDNVDADQLIRHADQAMYIAKESGKNRYHLFDTDQENAVKVQRESLEAIRSALDNDQFVLHYQPKVNMRTGTIIGFEALIRWQHPQRGLLNPIEFLPAIENPPMIIEMGEWVINTALTQISQWQGAGFDRPVSISVNITAVELQDPGFTDRLATSLEAHADVEPRYLGLEVLETSALDDVASVSTTMDACIAMGVNFALDDFGTGYSSLTYLRRLPVNVIKIDQSFVYDMLSDLDDLAIIEGVIALAKLFKRDVIAEGVETIEHGTALLALGCELAQGYGIARPMPAGDIPEWVSHWTPDDAWNSVDVK